MNNAGPPQSPQCPLLVLMRFPFMWCLLLVEQLIRFPLFTIYVLLLKNSIQIWVRNVITMQFLYLFIRFSLLVIRTNTTKHMYSSHHRSTMAAKTADSERAHTHTDTLTHFLRYIMWLPLATSSLFFTGALGGFGGLGGLGDFGISYWSWTMGTSGMSPVLGMRGISCANTHKYGTVR